MAKRASVFDKKEKAKTRAQKKTRDKADENSVEPKEAFDFGGLPSRDLKKNLGCG